MPESRFIFRGFELDRDLPRLVLLMQEGESVDQSGEDVSAETMQSFLDVSGHD